MKEPPLSHLRCKPFSATATVSAAANSQRKVKIVCSFNGAFYRSPPPFDRLRYVAGEARIISVDRNISLERLRSTISDLCPNTGSFSLKCRLLLAGDVRGLDAETNADEGTPLVSIASEEDVRCMIDEYDKLVAYGKHARLWVFVCSECKECDYDNNDAIDDHGIVKGNTDVVYGKYLSKDLVEVFEGKNCMNGVAGVGVRHGDDDSFRKTVSKQKYLANRTERIHGTCDDKTDMDFTSCRDDRKYDHPLMDLAPKAQVPVSQETRDLMLGYNLANTQLPDRENYGNLFLYQGSQLQYPLNPRDGNLCVDTNPSVQFSARESGQVLSNGAGMNMGNSTQLVGEIESMKQSFYSGLGSMLHGFDAKRHIEPRPMRYMHRENIMPWTANQDSMNTHTYMAPVSYSRHRIGSDHLVKSSYNGDRLLGSSPNGIRKRFYPYSFRNHRSNLTGIVNHRNLRLDGRLPTGKFYGRLKPNSDISKQGQPIRSHHPSSLKLLFPDKILEGMPSMIDSDLHKTNVSFPVQDIQEGGPWKQGGSAVLQYSNVNPHKYSFGYHGVRADGDGISLLSSNVTENALSCPRGTGTQQSFLTGMNYDITEIPHRAINENCKGIHINNEQEKILEMQHRVVAVSSNNPVHSNGTALECNIKKLDAGESLNLLIKIKTDSHNCQGRIATSVDLLHNLSLSSSKEEEHPVPSSHASSDVSDALPKPQSKPLDTMDEGNFSTDPQDDGSSGVVTNSSPLEAAKVPSKQIPEENVQQEAPPDLSNDNKADINRSHQFSKVTGRLSRELTAFIRHLATQELQTIKNSDLEYLKELGSGTYGTVYYGKWKGSDVAIKKIRPSYFTNGLSEEDRLVTDFWREAHMLGQLHHPNIVALYGVVTDGPVKTLATVTEYMVNGSLNQVLRKKDRTIDRRKRLIIARDAAFGMEYLHEKNIVHFDLKSHNFLVNMRDPQRPVCKIGDLGLSKIKQRTLVSGGVRGTIPWMAPELLNSKNNKVTEKVDVYSFGIVMWELLTGEEPYANFRSEEIIAGIIKGTLRPEIPCWCDPAWRSLMERCWSLDPNSRPPFSEISKELRAMAAAMNIK
ncbi:hypothetical protein HS088_TW23G00544 [Tripterygium wilfordii]|uniref:Protein kinase domain-containing protein n=1 Tax=Tripterygium wilfordii TaxID=458696 RepID=A0A7J7BVV2_TRIWF|nr:uncharacterized protein LOC119992512 [Tripterygium wilfordii]KAF5725815.1 hypothetical protein HS088_TW23G00544 [Tripterygium wilfordii]